MAEITNIFDFVNEEIKVENEKLQHHQVEAYQIIRLKRQTVGTISRREIIDTFMVEHGNPELALRKARYKAERIGNCMVVEKCERVVNTYAEDEPIEEDTDEDEY